MRTSAIHFQECVVCWGLVDEKVNFHVDRWQYRGLFNFRRVHERRNLYTRVGFDKFVARIIFLVSGEGKC